MDQRKLRHISISLRGWAAEKFKNSEKSFDLSEPEILISER